MRFFGNKQTPWHPVTPDTMVSKLLTAATAEAFDFPTGTDLFRVSVGTTASGFETAWINVGSTKATLPTTLHGQSTQGSSEFNIPVGLGEGRIFQRARASTGFSLIAVSSLYVCVEFWSRGASTST
jgi:hypothetical protein